MVGRAVPVTCPPMHSDLRESIDQMQQWMRSALEDLVRIPSVSAPGFDPGNVQASAEAAAALLETSGVYGVRLLEIEGAHPAVYGELPGGAGAQTVLLYAHHDVQPPGPADEWRSPPFEPVEREGRLHGRGSSDDKAGIVLHAAALRAHGARPPVGVKLFFEGEEEIGSRHLGAFLDTYGPLLEADAIVVADSANWKVGVPSFTTSLRGLVDCVVEVRVLRSAVHSGQFGGALPDAITALARVLATLHDERGRPAILGLRGYEGPALEYSEEDLRAQAEVLESVELIGEGSLSSRLWTRPAISVLAIDAPPVQEAINQLVPVARAKVSLRIAPGDDPDQAMNALTDHLRRAAPWGASVTITPGARGRAFTLDTGGPAYDAFSKGFREAWGTEPVETGVGGSIPFVAAFSEAYPEASIVLNGVADPTSHAHGPNESVDLQELFRGALAEAIALRLLG